jgi:hypothetical protein
MLFVLLTHKDLMMSINRFIPIAGLVGLFLGSGWFSSRQAVSVAEQQSQRRFSVKAAPASQANVTVQNAGYIPKTLTFSSSLSKVRTQNAFGWDDRIPMTASAHPWSTVEQSTSYPGDLPNYRSEVSGSPNFYHLNEHMTHQGDALMLGLLPNVSASSIPVQFAQNSQRYKQHNGKVSVIYYSSTRQLHRAMGRGFKDRRVIEKIAASITNKFNLRRDVKISLRQCGFANALYLSKHSEVVLCYELVEKIENDFAVAIGRQSSRASWGAFYTTLFILHHELAHALVDQFKLPLAKSGEDTADELGAVLAVDYTYGSDYGANIASITASQLFISAALTRNMPSPRDTHSSDAQRGSNIRCLVYGAPISQQTQVTLGKGVSPSRRQQCRVRYSKARSYWANVLKPYLREK